MGKDLYRKKRRANRSYIKVFWLDLETSSSLGIVSSAYSFSRDSGLTWEEVELPEYCKQ